MKINVSVWDDSGYVLCGGSFMRYICNYTLTQMRGNIFGVEDPKDRVAMLCSIHPFYYVADKRKQ